MTEVARDGESEASRSLERDLNAMQTEPVTPEELQQVKATLLREIPFSGASIDRIAGGWISRHDLNLPLDEPIRAAHRYVNLTAAEVETAFAKWLRVTDLFQPAKGRHRNFSC